MSALRVPAYHYIRNTTVKTVHTLTYVEGISTGIPKGP